MVDRIRLAAILLILGVAAFGGYVGYLRYEVCVHSLKLPWWYCLE